MRVSMEAPSNTENKQKHLIGHCYGGIVSSFIGSYLADSLGGDSRTGGSTSPGSCSNTIERVPVPQQIEQGIPPLPLQDVPPQWYTDEIKCRVSVTTFSRTAQQCFNQLLIGAIGSFQEFRSLFLHQLASSRKLKKTELSLFAVSQKDNEPLKEYLQRFNTASQEVPSANQEVKASAFSQGLLDGDFFKSLAKKTV
ncbi:hypothetical protein Sango_2437900 [Sesamum angolense]|uniref:Retrotransposon gag domain-containing protein n=1 Tax=Sesamum angolense TaxID=2727404 RepID=A0AAE1W7Q2_9LAMI|nr:hypothetical protein Sango_2437900 [Sesamum angolense]